MIAAVRLAMVAIGLASLAACHQSDKKAPVAVRPVLSVVARAEHARQIGFVGTVQPKVSTKIGFRVFGRIISRPVNVGDVVTKGTHLASIDPVALTQAVKLAESDLDSAKAQLTNAASTQTREQTLAKLNVVSQADFEAAQQSRDSATAAVARGEANLTKAKAQLGYAEIYADGDGVVTSVDAEVGQVVSDAQTVVTIARSDVREAVIDVPESFSVEIGAFFNVALQTDPTSRALAKVREIAPQADAATRTRRVKMTLIDPPANFRLGTTVGITVTTKTEPGIELPRSAVLEKDGESFVWIVDPAAATVSLRKIAIGQASSDGVRVSSGVAEGDRVVIAGVHSLREGQSVNLSDKAER